MRKKEASELYIISLIIMSSLVLLENDDDDDDDGYLLFVTSQQKWQGNSKNVIVILFFISFCNLLQKLVVNSFFTAYILTNPQSTHSHTHKKRNKLVLLQWTLTTQIRHYYFNFRETKRLPLVFSIKDLNRKKLVKKKMPLFMNIMMMTLRYNVSTEEDNDHVIIIFTSTWKEHLQQYNNSWQYIRTKKRY